MHRAMIRIAVKGTSKTTIGATLIEVMVALVILSIGLLGLASLQLSGVSNNSNSEKRTQAAILSNDMVERMRANLDQVTVTTSAYANALPSGAAFNCANPPATVCEDSGGTAAANCSTAQLASFDVYTAWCNAQTLLPNGKIVVVCSDQLGATQACPADYRTITVSWDYKSGTGFTTRSLTTTFRP